MAGRRLFETQFAFNAVLNGGFKATLTEAQREFLRLGEEIKKVNAIQKDISAYQSLQKAIDNTSAKLKYLEQRQEKVSDQKGFLEKQIENAKKDGEATAALERQKAALEERETVLGESFRRTSAAMKEQEKKADALAGRLQEAGVNLNDLGAAGRKSAGELESLKRAQERVAAGARETGKTGTEAVEAVSAALAAAGVLNGLKKLADGFAECTRTAAEFNRAMSAVEAIAGASEREINALNDEAKRLGASTVFTAQQSAEAMNYMAMAGWKTREMLDGMSGVMNAAAASGEDLASVSDIITDSLTAFGLTAADAAHFSDILAQASARSNTNIGMMGSTFQRAAPVAAALGFSAEDTAVAIGLMANSGIKASRAGTALVNIFNGLLEGVTLTGEAFGAYEFSAIRADGTMKGLAGTIDELRGKFAQMSEAEKVMNAKEIAGLRGYSGLLAILNSTEEEYRSLQEEIDNCAGAAARMAGIKLDNLSGDVTLMKSAFEGLKITIGEQFTPELRWGAKALTTLTGGVDQFVQKTPGLVKILTGTAGGFAAVAGAVTAANSAIKLFNTAKTAGLFAGLSGGLLGVGAAVGGMIGLGAALKADWEAAVPAAVELNSAVKDLNRTLEETSVHDIENEAAANAAAAEAYLSKIEKLGAVQDRTREQEILYQGALAGLLEIAPELSGCISQTADEYGRVTRAVNGSTEAIRANIEAMKQQAMMEELQDRIKEIAGSMGTAMVNIELAEINRAELEEQYKEPLRRREELQKKLDDAAIRSSGADTTAETRNLREEMDALELQYGYIFRQADYYTQQIAQGNEAVAEADKELLLYNEALDGVAEKMGVAGDGAGQFAAGTDEAAESVGAMPGPLEAVTADVEKLAEAYGEAYDAALEAIQGQYSLWDEAEKTAPSNLSSVENAMRSQIDNWTARTDNIELLSRYVGDVSGLYTLIGELSRDNSQESANLLAGLAGAASEEDLETLREFAKVYIDLKESEKKAAETTVNLQPEWEEAYGNFQKTMDESIEAMDKSTESKAAAHAIVQAFIDEANDPANLAEVRRVYARLSGEAIRQLNAAQGSLSLLPAGGMTPTAILRSEAAYYHYTAWAEGGILDRPHIGLVAEDGPEAVIPLSASRRERGAGLWAEAGRRMGLLADETPDSGSGGAPNISVTFNLSVAPGTPEETVGSFREFLDSSEFRDRVAYIQAELAYDARRRGLS